MGLQPKIKNKCYYCRAIANINMSPKKENNGCGCSSIPISLILVLLGVGYWGFKNLDRLDISQFLPNNQPPIADMPSAPIKRVPVASSPSPKVISTKTPIPTPQVSASPVIPKKLSQTLWEKKEIRGIYLSRYQATNNASEQTIR